MWADPTQVASTPVVPLNSFRSHPVAFPVDPVQNGEYPRRPNPHKPTHEQMLAKGFVPDQVYTDGFGRKVTTYKDPRRMPAAHIDRRPLAEDMQRPNRKLVAMQGGHASDPVPVRDMTLADNFVADGTNDVQAQQNVIRAELHDRTDRMLEGGRRETVEREFQGGEKAGFKGYQQIARHIGFNNPTMRDQTPRGETARTHLTSGMTQGAQPLADTRPPPKRMGLRRRNADAQVIPEGAGGYKPTEVMREDTHRNQYGPKPDVMNATQMPVSSNNNPQNKESMRPQDSNRTVYSNAVRPGVMLVQDTTEVLDTYDDRPETQRVDQPAPKGTAQVQLNNGQVVKVFMATENDRAEPMRVDMPAQEPQQMVVIPQQGIQADNRDRKAPSREKNVMDLDRTGQMGAIQQGLFKTIATRDPRTSDSYQGVRGIPSFLGSLVSGITAVVSNLRTRRGTSASAESYSAKADRGAPLQGDTVGQWGINERLEAYSKDSAMLPEDVGAWAPDNGGAGLWQLQTRVSATDEDLELLVQNAAQRLPLAVVGM